MICKDYTISIDAKKNCNNFDAKNKFWENYKM